MSRVLPLALICLLFAGPLRADLAAYLAQPDASFSWNDDGTMPGAGKRFRRLRLTSQTWQGKAWEHTLLVILPTEPAPGATWTLIMAGGEASDTRNLVLANLLAAKLRAPLAFLLDVPNQPFFGEREDKLIATTFDRYLKTGDPSLPIVFPMVKSGVRAMDALQAWAGTQPGIVRPEKFVIGGFFKHAWATWLIAPTDKRIAAIAPVMTNFFRVEAQAPHLHESLGMWRESLASYFQLNVLPGAGREGLWQMVDPWFIREKLTMPKLVVQASNDEDWPVDAPNLYWGELPGPKWLSILPNVQHDLMDRKADGTVGDPLLTANAFCAFARHIVTGRPLPEVTWTFQEAPGGGIALAFAAGGDPEKRELWRATAPTRNFLPQRWEATALATGAHTEPAPASGFTAIFATASYEIDGIPYTLSTEARVIGAKP